MVGLALLLVLATTDSTPTPTATAAPTANPTAVATPTRTPSSPSYASGIRSPATVRELDLGESQSPADNPDLSAPQGGSGLAAIASKIKIKRDQLPGGTITNGDVDDIQPTKHPATSEEYRGLLKPVVNEFVADTEAFAGSLNSLGQRAMEDTHGSETVQSILRQKVADFRRFAARIADVEPPPEWKARHQELRAWVRTCENAASRVLAYVQTPGKHELEGLQSTVDELSNRSRSLATVFNQR